METWNYLERREEGLAGEIKALASTALGAKRVATAVSDAAGNLKIIIWEITYDGSVKRLGSEEGGPTTKMAIAELAEALKMDDDDLVIPHRNRFVTAARTEAGGLKVTAWDADKDGRVTRGGSEETGEIHGEFALITISNNFAVTAVRDSEDHLKLISWQVYTDGRVERVQDASVDEKVGQIAIATYDPYPPHKATFATVVTTRLGNLKITSWSLDSGGVLHRMEETERRGAVRDIAASMLSHRRIAIAVRNLDNELEVHSWDFDGSGHISLHATGKAGKIGRLAMATHNASRIFTAVSDSNGKLKIIAWDAVDDIVRLGDVTAGTVGSVSIVPIGSDWIATPVETAEKTLKVIAWREHGISLLRGKWQPLTRKLGALVNRRLSVSAAQFAMLSATERQEASVTRTESDEAPEVETSDDDQATTISPKWSLRKNPGIEGVDPMIAVGFNYVIVTQDHQIGFFDKDAEPLKKKNGDKWFLSTSEFFSGFLEGQRLDGSRNEHNINRHTGFATWSPGFAPWSAWSEYPPGHNGDPDASLAYDSSDSPLINEFFDTRVHFDPTSRRFFILAAARPPKKVGGVKVSTIINPLARRYWAFAVSKSEDPRKGFYQWMTTEAHWFDFPFLTVNDGVMVMATSVGTNAQAVQPFGMKPTVFVFAVDDLIHGKPYPRSHKFFPPDFPLTPSAKAYPDLFPLTHHGDTANRTFFVQPASEVIHVFSFKNPSDWKNFPPIDKTSASLIISGVKIPVGGQWCGATYRNGKIYLTWMNEVVAHVKDGKNGQFTIRILRLPLKSLGTEPVASSDPADGFLFRNFGYHDPDDSFNAVVSYEKPAIAVTKDGDMVILFCRVGFTKPLFPQVRYRVYYGDERGLCESRLLQAGEYMPMEVKEGETELTINTPNDRMDYQTAVIDPSDDRTVWMISEFADKGYHRRVPGGPLVPYEKKYRTVIGRVTP